MGSANLPSIEIVEQPAARGNSYHLWKNFFSARCIRGENSSKGNRTFPTIKLHGYSGEFEVVVSCVSEDEPHKPHPNNLTSGDCFGGICRMQVRDSDTVSFPELCIHKARRKSFDRRLSLRKDLDVDPFHTGFRCKVGDIDLTVVRLCFQVFLPDKRGKMTCIVPPVVSQPVYDKRHTDKKSPRFLKKHLFQQVEEQSELCDVTIQVGSWKRKYHWCVLCATSFFSKLYESNMTERRTDVINLSIGTPSSVQSALDFLYGKEPEVEIHSAYDITLVADFLMIDDLKDICIKKIKSFEVSLETCLSLMFISSRFDIVIPKLEQLYLSHIPELFRQTKMLEIDREAVQLIITDKTLSYVSRDDIFKFLLRWVGFKSERMSEFRELLSLFDMSEISSYLLAQLNDSHPGLLSINDSHADCATEHNKECDQFTEEKAYANFLAIYPPEETLFQVIFYAFSLDSNCWYRIPISTPICYALFLGSPGAVVYGKDTIFAFQYDTDALSVFNLATSHYTEKILKFSEEVDILPSHITLAVSGQRIYFIKNFQNVVFNTDVGDRANEGLVDQTRYELTARVYVSEDLDKTEVIMKPLSSLNDEVDNVCVAENFLCLLTIKSQRLTVLCLKRDIRTVIDLSSYNIIGENGIMSSSGRNVYILGACLVVHIKFEASPKKIIWKLYEICHTDVIDSMSLLALIQDKIVMQDFASKDTLKLKKLGNAELNGCNNDVRLIELPSDHINRPWQQVGLIQLPKQAMKCHIDCPHCIEKEADDSVFSVFSSDEDSSIEESDSFSDISLESDSSWENY